HRVWRTGKIYVVQPPEGRYHESLWEIAQNHLGDGRRYREIFELNAGRLQPDGSRLTIASLIRPGWILRMPGDAHGPGIRVVTLHEQAHGPSGDGTAGRDGTADGNGTAGRDGTVGGTGDGRSADTSGSPVARPGPASAGPASARPASAGPASAGPPSAGAPPGGAAPAARGGGGPPRAGAFFYAAPRPAPPAARPRPLPRGRRR